MMRRLAAAGLAVAFGCALPATAQGVRLKALGGVYGDTTGGKLYAPEGVAVAGTTLAVADTGNGRIVVFSIAAEQVVARAEYALAELPYPTRVAMSRSGELYVLDGKLRRIGKLTADGAFAGYLDLPARAVPRSLRVDREGKLWVLDVGRARVLTLGPGGAVERERALPAEPRDAFYSDVAVGARGDVFVLDSVGRRVLAARAGATEFSPFGGPLRDELDFATSLETHDSGLVLVADQNGGGIVVLGPDGSFRGRQSGPGWKEGMLRYPSALAVAGDHVFVADRGNARIELFTISP